MKKNKDKSYLEKKIEATINREPEKIEFIFQRAKLKMSNIQEVELISIIDTELNKKIRFVDDRLVIQYKLPDSYNYFNTIHEKNMRTKLQFAYNIAQKAKDHSLERLNLCICPENIVFNQGLKPIFLHYGVNESLPPYQKNDEVIWLETKATVANIIDNEYEFSAYLAHHETKEISELTYEIMTAVSYEDLLKIIKNEIDAADEYEQTIIHISKKKWTIYRYLTVGLATLLIPLLIYSSFALFFKMPEKNAYIDSNYYFQKEEYSSVVQSLGKYQPDQMPKIVQYQLALSYLTNESLTENQRQNIENALGLESDSSYFLYWINIGRGNYQDAIDTARILEDRDLIVYGLLKEREDIKSNQTLTGEEREEQIKKIQTEIDEYQKAIEESMEMDQEQEEGNSEKDSEEESEEIQE